MTIRLALVGYGQIARVQHLPSIDGSPDFTLAAIVNPVPVAVPDAVPLFNSLPDMLAAMPDGIDAVALCTPPQVRYALAREALAAGLHVLLEKPPAQTVAEIDDLASFAASRGRTVFTAWHSMFAGAVAPARDILADRGASAMRIVWHEDVNKFHPGVDWFWQPGGMGVFDSGVNALSIAVACLSEPLFVRAARFRVNDGAHTPVAAELDLATPTHPNGFSASLNWDHAGEERWTIDWTLDDGGILALSRGGASLSLDGQTLLSEPDAEYPRLYAHFAALIRDHRSDAETRPLRLAADAYSLARRDLA
jgi:D-galactose 1-dehydrogenase